MIPLYPILECKGRCGGKTEHKRTGRIVGEIDRVQYTCQICARVSEHSEKKLTAQADDEQHASLLVTIAAIDESKAKEIAPETSQTTPELDAALLNLAGQVLEATETPTSEPAPAMLEPPPFDYDEWAAKNLAGTAETKARWLDTITGDNVARRDALLRLAARLRNGDIHA